MRKASGLNPAEWKQLFTHSDSPQYTLSTMEAFVARIEGCFTPGAEPTLREWYSVENLLMPVWSETKALRNLRRLRMLLVPNVAHHAEVPVSRWWEWETRTGVPFDYRHAVSNALACPVESLSTIEEQHGRPDTFARWLYFQRYTRNLNDRVFSARMRITPERLFKWECGREHVPQDRLVRIARALGVPVEEVIRAYNA